MLSRNQIKYINSLKLKKFRVEENRFVIEGTKIVSEFIGSAFKIVQVYASAAFAEKIDKGNLPGFELIEVSESELKKISNLTSPNDVLAIVEIPAIGLNVESLSSQLSIVLDDMSDPGNLGTIIRIADWYGIENVICSLDSVDAYNSKVVQATMGSIARVKVHYTSLIDFFKKTKNTIPIYGALLEGENIYRQKLSNNGLILIGNESRGISEKLFPYITNKITIPSNAISSLDGIGERSLNAAVATAIICSEFRRVQF